MKYDLSRFVKYFAYYSNLRIKGLFNHYEKRNKMLLANQKPDNFVNATLLGEKSIKTII